MQPSGIEKAIQELESDKKRIEEAVSTLKRLGMQRSTARLGSRRRGRRLSAKARRRISKATRSRWTALSPSGKESSKALEALASVFSRM